MSKKDEAKGTQVAVINYEADAGAGLEGVDKDSYAIPFLGILQPLSPAVVDGTVDGAKAGLWINSVTNELFGDSVIIIPCAFQRRWVRWGSRDAPGGGGFKGEMTTADMQALRDRGEVKEVDGRLFFPLADGSVNEKTSDRLTDTRNHYCLVLRSADDVIGTPMVMALTSTGIKASKHLISRIDGIKMARADKSLFTPPSYSHMYAMSSKKKQNDKGTWWAPEVDMVGPVKAPGLYAMAKAFHAQVTSGAVVVAHDSMHPEGGAAGEGKKGF